MKITERFLKAAREREHAVTVVLLCIGCLALQLYPSAGDLQLSRLSRSESAAAPGARILTPLHQAAPQASATPSDAARSSSAVATGTPASDAPVPRAFSASSRGASRRPVVGDAPSPTPDASAGSEPFPQFFRAVNVVSSVPNWGAMRTPGEWNRTYDELTSKDFVPVPAYLPSKLTVPMDLLTQPVTAKSIPEITRKLFYSTRFFGAYDLDAGEFTGSHPGIDLKLPRGTPVGSIGGGLVRSVSTHRKLGLHVIIEHRVGGEAFYSIYGHLDSAAVDPGDAVFPGQVIGRVGMTGNTSAPHLHLQIDRGEPGEAEHRPYVPTVLPTPEEAARSVVNPAVFIAAHARGESAD